MINTLSAGQARWPCLLCHLVSKTQEGADAELLVVLQRLGQRLGVLLAHWVARQQLQLLQTLPGGTEGAEGTEEAVEDKALGLGNHG